MMRSMYAGVSGLRNHQLRMDTIGNNIANVNTYGFKKSRVVFKDALYQTIRGGSAPATDRGGTNPMAIGLGVTVGSIDQITTPGSTQTTGKNTDLAIDGNGYFIMEAGGERYYTRAGNFDFDKLGNYLSPGNGMRVQGWMADIEGGWAIDSTKSLQNLDISGYKTISPQETTTVRFQGNCDSTLVPMKTVTAANASGAVVAGHETKLTSKDVYDTLGNKHTIYFRFEKVAASDNMLTAAGMANQALNNAAGFPGTVWRMRASTDSTFPVPTTGASSSQDYYMLFNSDGQMTDVSQWQMPAASTYPTDANLQWDDATNGIWQHCFDPTTAGGPLHAATTLTQNLTLNLTALVDPFAGVGTPQTMVLNFADTSGNPMVFQHQATHTAYAEYQDGYTKGDLRNVSIDQSGTILGAFSNGISKNLGRIALATFQNPGGLLQKGANLLQESNNSGDPKVGAPGEEQSGVIMPGSLEMSNVDLSEEFTDMIVTQRGFQANSRVITTSDEMLQELVNLKR
ncbi:MAG: flagellar hook protein FlgE [Acidobacteriota bacterium]